MTQVFRSGAFLQQCWSVHPLCLAVKRMAEGSTLILSCSSCRFAHHLAVSSIALRASAVPDQVDDPAIDRPVSTDGPSRFAECLHAHAQELSLRSMDVFEDLAMIRCAECRRHYVVVVSSFETHQK